MNDFEKPKTSSVRELDSLSSLVDSQENELPEEAPNPLVFDNVNREKSPMGSFDDGPSPPPWINTTESPINWGDFEEFQKLPETSSIQEFDSFSGLGDGQENVLAIGSSHFDIEGYINYVSSLLLHDIETKPQEGLPEHYCWFITQMMGGRELCFVIQKSLYRSDVDAKQIGFPFP